MEACERREGRDIGDLVGAEDEFLEAWEGSERRYVSYKVIVEVEPLEACERRECRDIGDLVGAEDELLQAGEGNKRSDVGYIVAIQI